MKDIFESYSKVWFELVESQVVIMILKDVVLRERPNKTYSTATLVFDLSLSYFYLSAWENEEDEDPDLQINLKISLDG